MGWFALIGAGLAAASKVQEGRNDAAWADYQSRQVEADAAAEKGASQVHAANIRSAADKQRSRVRAAMAASGVQVDAPGTPTIVDSAISSDAEHDAFLTLIGGEDALKRAQQQSTGLQIQGDRAKKAGYAGAVTSMLAGASAYGSGSKSVGWMGGKSGGSIINNSAGNGYGMPTG